MNELQIFSNPTVAELKKVYPYDKRSCLGHFYLLEYGTNLKIGSTVNPSDRFSSLMRGATKYGDVEIGKFACSVPHTNFRENEALIHKVLSNRRVPGTELFNASMDEALAIIRKTSIEYRDDSQAIEERSEAFLEFAKEFTGLGLAVDNLKSANTTGEISQTFTNTDTGVSVRLRKDSDGNVFISAEDAAIGLGWTQTKNGVLYVKWERLNQNIAALGFSPNVGKDDYIPEQLFYLLAMKANNGAALNFQKWLAFEVVPALRKTGRYTVQNVEPEPEQRVLTPDDYLAAARVLSTCRNERLPYVLSLLKKAGLDLPKPEPKQLPPIKAFEPLQPVKVIVPPKQEPGVSAAERARMRAEILAKYPHLKDEYE